MTRREKLIAYGAWAAVCFFWGTTYLGIRVGLETLPPALFSGARFLTAGLILLVFMRLRGASLPRGSAWLSLGVVGILLLGIGNGLVVWAEQWIPSGFAALLLAAAPFWMVGLDSLTEEGERFTKRIVLGLMVGTSGMVLLVAPQLFGASFNGHYWLGLLALQLGSIAWCGGSVFGKRRPVNVAPLMAAAVQMLAAGAGLALLGLMTGEAARFHFSGRTLAAFIYLVIFGSLVGYTSYIYIVQKLPLSLVSMHSYINPVIAVLLGWALLSEPLNWRVALAAAIILGGVALVKTAPKPQPAPSPESVPEHLSATPETCAATT